MVLQELPPASSAAAAGSKEDLPVFEKELQTVATESLDCPNAFQHEASAAHRV